MNDLKRDIAELLLIEMVEKDMFDSAVVQGVMTLENLEELRAITMNPDLFQQEIEHLSKQEIFQNPYLRDIKVPNVTLNHVRLSNQRMVKKDAIVAYKEKSRNLDTFEQEVSYFTCDENLHFPAITEGDTNVCWMSVEPSEISSFQPFVEEAKGNVLLIGCGLGYAAYMLSLKEEVTHITIVDLNPDILQIFSTHLLPQFSHRSKISLVCADAMEFLYAQDLSAYDHINVDIWHDTTDMIGYYVRCLEVEAKYPNTQFSYWLEKELKEMVQKNILSEFAGVGHQLHIFESIAKFILEEEPLNSKQDLKRVLQLPQFRQTLYRWYQENAHRLSAYQYECDAFMNDCLKRARTMKETKKEPN